MVEAVITVVLEESSATGSHPYTRVHRVEFDTKEDLYAWLSKADNEGIHTEELTAE